MSQQERSGEEDEEKSSSMAQMCPEYIDVCINFITAVHARYR
jgi:hypothetical protein